MTVIRVLVALTMGFFSGFLVYMAAAMLFADGKRSGEFVAITFLGGWVFSVLLLLRGTRTVSRGFRAGVLARSCGVARNDSCGLGLQRETPLADHDLRSL
jgi:hypothetical protein